jgi:NitT/TauT family transport system substrate-binding protein
MNSRRNFLRGVTLVGTAGFLGVRPSPAAAEPPPETRRIRLIQIPAICLAAQYVAEELLRGEGFTDVQYVKTAVGEQVFKTVASGAVDLSTDTAPSLVLEVDAGTPIVVVAGIHVGCYELIGTDRVRRILDLKGKSVAAADPGRRAFIASMALQVGLDPRTDIQWVEKSGEEAIRLLADGKIDAYLGFPPEPQEMRAKKIGHVVINTATDRPWSQYFCCMTFTSAEFARRNPVATKRAIRAILKADRICALEPEMAARTIVNRGFTPSYDYALQTMKGLPYGRWREFSPEDTLRFYALRLHEAGLIKSNPQKILAQGTDWRFLNELKKELKG